MARRLVGVFDSGMGGLTVLRALLDMRLETDYLYLGDTARLPYGTKSEHTVRRYALALGRFLAGRGVDLLVVACNTVSAVALDALEHELAIPVVGVVEPGARSAVAGEAPIGVLGTEATVASGAYERAIHRLVPGLDVRSQSCPLFVPLVEEGWTRGEVPLLVAGRYLAKLDGAKTLLLGCTHYPLLTGVLRELRPDARIVDSATAVAEEVRSRFVGASGAGEGEVHYFVTDAPARFRRLGRLFLGRELDRVDLIDV